MVKVLIEFGHVRAQGPPLLGFSSICGDHGTFIVSVGTSLTVGVPCRELRRVGPMCHQGLTHFLPSHMTSLSWRRTICRWGGLPWLRKPWSMACTQSINSGSSLGSRAPRSIPRATADRIAWGGQTPKAWGLVGSCRWLVWPVRSHGCGPRRPSLHECGIHRRIVGMHSRWTAYCYLKVA